MAQYTRNGVVKRKPTSTMKKRRRQLKLGRLLMLGGCLGLIFISFLGGAILWYLLDIKTPTATANDSPGRFSRFLFLREAVANKTRRSDYTTIDKMPQDLKNAIVAVEDSRFYEHCGFDPTGIARASLVNLQEGSIQEGASTITQQLVKNLFLSPEQTFERKAEECLLALDMEANYNKEEILELYLNNIYFGSNFYGITAASRGYFDKLPQELNLAEAAMLAGLPNAPSLYSPYVDFLLAKKRQLIVLDAMVSNGYIDRTTAEDAKIKPLSLARRVE